MNLARLFRPVVFLVLLIPAAACAGASEPIPAPDLAGGQVEIELDQQQDSIRTGGAGRYLIFLCREAKKLSIFDVSQARIVHQIEIPNGDIAYAAGLDKLIVAVPSQNLIHRYSLQDFRREKTVPLPEEDEPLRGTIMGSGSRGPLLLWYTVKGKYWDVDQMKLLPLKGEAFQGAPYLRKSFSIRVSTDGQTFVGWLTGISGQTYKMLRLADGAGSIITSPDSHSHNGHWAQPNADGSLVVRYGGGIYVRDFKVVPGGGFGGSVLLPTEDPRFFLSVRPTDGNKKSQAAICTTADRLVMHTVKGLEQVAGASLSTQRGLFSGEAFFRYLPSANVLLTLPESNDRVVLRRLDLAEAERLGEDYLFVISKPDNVATVSSTFKYQVELLSKSPEVEYQLESGPEGMTVSDSGAVQWEVKTRPIGGSAEAIVSIRNDAGTEVFHTFHLSVVRPAGAVAAAEPGGETKDPGRTAEDAPAPAGEVVKVDENRLELPAGGFRIVPGLDYRSLLLLQNNRLVRLGPDGVTVQDQWQFEKKYSFIAERPDYFVAATVNPSAIELIDKESKEITKSISLRFYKLTDLALHPTKPICYVAHYAGTDLPGYKFVMYDESTGEGRESESYIGNWLHVHPNGRLLISGYADTYESGSRLLLNPDRIHLLPEYGDICWLIRYQIDRNGIPQVKELKQKAGGNGKGMRMSRDGSRVTFLSHVGYPEFSNNLGGWDPDDLHKIPVTYAVKNGGTPYELAYHPVLPLVASRGSGSAVFFHRERRAEEDRLDLPPDGLGNVEVHRIYFSPGGKHLVFDTSVNGVHYLQKVALKLSEAEIDGIARDQDRPGTAMAGVAVSEPVKVPLADLDTFSGGEGRSMTAKDVGRAFMDSVVVVRSPGSSGTGFVVGSRGYIVTCAHCLPEVGQPEISYRRRVDDRVISETRAAQLLYFDGQRDLALVKIDAPEPLSPVRLATGGVVESGETVSIIGNPGLGAAILDYTMTQGIVSNPNRELDGRKLIQTSASVNPGSSGGPMFNSQGLVIGLVVSKARIEGAGFAVPAGELVEFLLAGTKRDGPDGMLMRKWIDATGKFRIDARLGGTSGDSLRLVKTDGAEANVPLNRLSAADRVFAQFLRGTTYPNPLCGPGSRPPVMPWEEEEPWESDEPVAPSGGDTLEQAVAWVRQHNVFGPNTKIVEDTRVQIGARVSKGVGYAFKLGAGLVKSHKPTVLAGHRDHFFVFELSPDLAHNFGIVEMGIACEPVSRDDAPRRASTDIVLSELKIENPAQIAPDGTIKGTVAFRGADPGEGNFALRLKCRNLTVYHHLSDWIKSESGEFSFAFKPESLSSLKGTQVVFIELCEFVPTRRSPHVVLLSDCAAAVINVKQ